MNEQDSARSSTAFLISTQIDTEHLFGKQPQSAFEVFALFGSEYGAGMARRGITGPPRSFLVSGEWPDGKVKGPAPALYAAEVACRLRDAVGSRPLREVANLADLDHTTLWAVLRGDRWPDLVTIAKLESALDVRLWPDGSVG